MLKTTYLPNSKDLVYKDGFFVEKSFWNIKKIVVLTLALGFLSCSYKPDVPVAPTILPSPVEAVPSLEDKLTLYIQQYNKTIAVPDVVGIADATVKWANHFKIDPVLITAVQQVESGFNKFSISSGGALGVMQMIPSWHLAKLKVATKELGTPELFDPNVNIYVGAWILKECFAKYKNQVGALRCYNGSNATPNGYEDKVKAAASSISKFVT